MPQSLTPEQVEQQYKDAMGPELGQYYHALYVDVVWLHDKWREYETLFGASPQRIELLSQTAGHFFASLQDSAFEDTLLHLSRLTDSAKTGKRENLSLAGLPTLIADDELRSRTEVQIAQAADKCRFARDWRNRRISHRDRPLELDPAAPQLERASRLAVAEAIQAITEVMALLHEKYVGGGIDFRPLGIAGDATDLLRVLSDGLLMARLREKWFETGRLESGDLEPDATI